MSDYETGPADKADLAIWNEGAHTYADLSKVDPFKEELDDPAFLALLGKVHGLHVLDLGCGDGAFCRKLKAQGAITTGIDGSQQMLERARTADPDGDYWAADIGNYGLPQEPGVYYDIVTAKMSLMCVSSLGVVARNANRVLVNDGFFAADIVHPVQPLLSKLSGQETMYKLPSDYAYEEETRGAITFGDATFPFYNRPVSSYVNEITAAGFTLCRMGEVVIDDDFAQRYPAYADAANQPISMHLLFQAQAKV
jgi:SAM-dependent methyltransferase